MNCLDVSRKKDKLDYLYKKAAVLEYDAELQSHWARYLCVLTAGFIELALQDLYRQHAQTTANVTSRYVSNQLKQFQNAKMEKICQLAGSFSEEWRTDLESKSSGELKDAIDSIVAQRHNIAHGRDSNITYSVLKEYYRNAWKVLEIIDNQLHSN